MATVSIIIVIIKSTIALTECITVGRQFAVVEFMVSAAKYPEVFSSELKPDSHEMNRQHYKSLGWGAV